MNAAAPPVALRAPPSPKSEREQDGAFSESLPDFGMGSAPRQRAIGFEQ
jgi:hypothetical protein